MLWRCVLRSICSEQLLRAHSSAALASLNRSFSSAPCRALWAPGIPVLRQSPSWSGSAEVNSEWVGRGEVAAAPVARTALAVMHRKLLSQLPGLQRLPPPPTKLCHNAAQSLRGGLGARGRRPRRGGPGNADARLVEAPCSGTAQRRLTPRSVGGAPMSSTGRETWTAATPVLSTCGASARRGALPD